MRTPMLADGAPAELVARCLGPLADADQLAADIDEPLRTSAPVAFDVARTTCRPGEPGHECGAYHAVWQYLRLTGVIRSLRSDGPLFVAAASRRARQGHLRRVLISGTADYSMLAYLGHAARQAGAATEFDVVDRCESSLRMNRWYAEHRGLTVRTIATDVLAFKPDRPYDLICAHSFLAWLRAEDRPLLVKLWRDWLAPGGEVCLSNRVDSESGWAAGSDHAQRVERFSGEFFSRCADLHVDLPTDRESFARLLVRYSERGLYRKRDMPMAALRDWVESAGLDLELTIPVADVVANANDRNSMPVKTGGRPRTWFLARRA